MAKVFLYPTGAGDETNITSVYGSATHWGAVDEPVANDNIDYVYCTGTSYLRDLYTFQPMPVADCVIKSVTFHFRIWQTAGAVSQAKAKPSYKSGGAVYDGTEVFTGNVPGTWTSHSQKYTINDATGVAFTLAEVNSLQAGPSLNANVAATYYVADTSFCLEVDYYIVGTADAITRDTSVARYYNRKARMLRMSVGLGGLATIPMLASEGFKPTPTVGETGSTPSLDMIQKAFDSFNDFFTFPGKLPGIVTPQSPYTIPLPNVKPGELGWGEDETPHVPQLPQLEGQPLPPIITGATGTSWPGLPEDMPMGFNPPPSLPSLPSLPDFNTSDGESIGNKNPSRGKVNPLTGEIIGNSGTGMWDF